MTTEQTGAQDTDTVRKELEEYAKVQKEADERLAQLLATPISREEAEKKFADNKIESVKLEIVRRKWLSQIDVLQTEINRIHRQIADLDDRIMQLRLDDAVTFRRGLNPPATEGQTGMGQPVGGPQE